MSLLEIECSIESEALSPELSASLAELAQRVQQRHQLTGPITLVLTDDAHMQALNAQFRQKDRTTDVLSFDLGTPPEIDGGDGTAYKEIYISVEQAQRQAEALCVALPEELARLFVHGLLHLSGWEHETEETLQRMERETDEILNALGLLPT